MSKHRCFPGFAAMAVCVLTLAGCSGGDTAGPQASPTRSPADPPAAYLRLGVDQAVPGGVGSFCWKQVCKDSAGVVTAADPVEMAAGAPVAVSYDPTRPAVSEVEWHVAVDPAPTPASFGRAWADEGALAAGNAAVAPSQPGDYLLVVFARWEREGDVTYGWFVRIK